MTTFVIIFNILCVAWCCGLGVFVVVKRMINTKKTKQKLEKEIKENEENK